jgi:hypothetical protein
MYEGKNVLPFLLTESLNLIRGLLSQDFLVDVRDSVIILQSICRVQEHPEH